MLLLFICTMKNQVLTDLMTVRHVFVAIVTNYMVALTIPLFLLCFVKDHKEDSLLSMSSHLALAEHKLNDCYQVGSWIGRSLIANEQSMFSLP